ncbi:MAG: pantoate--beta-alanine ligase [Verrucomicrobiota bacterium]|nr:pantoate--beta-alanine ligase [Verrucomicrobiota bacterium]
MQKIETVRDMQSLAEKLRAKGRRIGFVPTMGALHAGHLSLVKAARSKADAVVVSIFVNPTQFGPSEDYTRYPRSLDEDLKLCEEAGADAVFCPPAEEIYPKNYSTYVIEEAVSKVLEGVSRPAHFRGVATIVAKFFNIIRPHVAVFGQKDAQQVAMLKKMVADLNFSVEIVVAPTVREADGLAMSSRNRYLTPGQRTDALVISQAFRQARDMVAAGERRADRLIAETTHLISQRRRLRVIYVALVDRDTMEPLREVAPGRSLLTVAAWVDEVRLIDNVEL